MMHWISIILLLLVIEKGNTDKPISLKDLQWKNRVVLYFPSADESIVEFSSSEIKSIQERKILYWIYSQPMKSNFTAAVKDVEVQALKKKYSINDGKQLWLLIGLDGGIKVYREEPLNWDYIFKTIDSMPMRQSEIGKIR